jgi:hypothetical protein
MVKATCSPADPNLDNRIPDKRNEFDYHNKQLNLIHISKNLINHTLKSQEDWKFMQPMSYMMPSKALRMYKANLLVMNSEGLWLFTHGLTQRVGKSFFWGYCL